MDIHRNATVRALVYALACAVLSACGTMDFRVSIEVPADKEPAPEKSPLHAGVYFSPRFSAEEVARSGGSRSVWTAPIGEASVKMFTGAFARVFARTSPLANLSAAEIAAKGVDVVIAPTLAHFDFRLGMDNDSERYSVIYRVTLYTPAGVPAASWLVAGNAGRNRSGAFVTPGMRIEDDIADARALFLKEFSHNAGPALAAISRARDTPPARLDPSQVRFSAERSVLPGLSFNQKAALRDAGFVIVEVTAQNRGDGSLVMRASDMRLRTADGRVHEPAPLSVALSALESAQITATESAMAGPLLGTVIMVSRMREAQAERDMQVQVGNQALFNERALGGDKEETGLVIFRLPQGVKDTTGMTLSTWLVDPRTLRSVQVEASVAD